MDKTHFAKYLSQALIKNEKVYTNIVDDDLGNILKAYQTKHDFFPSSLEVFVRGYRLKENEIQLLSKQRCFQIDEEIAENLNTNENIVVSYIRTFHDEKVVKDVW